MDTYPIIIDAMPSGELRVHKQGLKTVFEGEASAEGLVRLSVYGIAREGYLGVMQPRGERLYIKRAFSAAAMRGFPETIEYAARAGETPPQLSEQAEPEMTEEPPPPPQSEQELPKDILWFSTPRGELTAFDGGQSLIAIPAERARLSGGVERIIEGRRYRVFPGLRGRGG